MKSIASFVLLVCLHGCAVLPKGDNAEARDIGVLISISDRELYLYEEGEKIRSYDVAVGQEEYPTIPGNFEIFQIDWNPDWTPPDSDWAKSADYKSPGAPGNPMGRVRINYNPPYTIHGTQDLKSLGTAASHGSVRMANPDIIELAKIIMEVTGDSKPEEWYETVLANPNSMVSVELSKPFPLTIRP